MRILHVVGARPNFMKAAPVMAALAGRNGIRQTLVHTGQHYDANMSGIFFRQLGLPEPDINLEVGSGSHAQQTAEIMSRFEAVVLERRPDWVLVYGDVNSTVAAALVCAKLLIPVGHVEAGLRSFDRAMPEEINRLLTDQIADLLFTPSVDGNRNLRREGVVEDKIHLVGNVMIDTLMRLLPEAEARWDELRARFNLEKYGLVTLHRPSNVDEPVMLAEIIETLVDISRDIPVIFPIHPRTRRRLEHSQSRVFPIIRGENLCGLESYPKLLRSYSISKLQLYLVDPLSYLDFLALQSHATLVITDSGGIQEESTFLGVPCLTVRKNTERPVTVELGANRLVGQDMALLRREVARILAGEAKQGQRPPLWDGRAGQRIANILTG